MVFIFFKDIAQKNYFILGLVEVGILLLEGFLGRCLICEEMGMY